MRPRKAAHGSGLPHHLPNGARLAKAFDRVLTNKRKIKKISRELMCGRPDQHTAGLGEGLSCAKIRCVANHGLFAVRTHTRFSRDHHSGRDPDAALQRQLIWTFDLTDRFDDFERGPDGTFGCVLLGLRKSKINKHPVAEVLRDKAFVFFDHRDAFLAVSTQQAKKIFRIEFCTERG